jgi:hypothetical protein
MDHVLGILTPHGLAAPTTSILAAMPAKLCCPECGGRDIDILSAYPVEDWPGHSHVLATQHLDGRLCYERRYLEERRSVDVDAVDRPDGD